jgi:hypothetical protein
MRGTSGYSRSVMGTVLGLLGLIVFCAVVISLAAGVTLLVVKIFPSGSKKKKPPEPQTS